MKLINQVQFVLVIEELDPSLIIHSCVVVVLNAYRSGLAEPQVFLVFAWHRHAFFQVFVYFMSF